MTTIYETVKNGKPLNDITVIDSHCHMGDSFGSTYIPDGSPQAIIRAMDILGINIACVAHHASLGAGHNWGNDRIMEAAEKYPGRFYAYCTINPFYPEDIPLELERCFKNEYVKGIKIHPHIHERTMDYKNYIPVYEYAANKRCPVLVHVYSVEEIRNMGRFASEYPDAVFIMAHIGGEAAYMEKAIDVINHHDNIYGDFAVSRAWERNVEWLVSEVGSEKLLFGSDTPFFSPVPTIARIAMAEIDEKDKMNILGLNMKKILRI